MVQTYSKSAFRIAGIRSNLLQSHDTNRWVDIKLQLRHMLFGVCSVYSVSKWAHNINVYAYVLANGDLVNTTHRAQKAIQLILE